MTHEHQPARPARAAESVEEFSNKFAARYEWKISPSILADTLRPWVDEIRAAERAPLEARIAELEAELSKWQKTAGAMEALARKLTPHEVEEIRQAEARAQRAEEALDNVLDTAGAWLAHHGYWDPKEPMSPYYRERLGTDIPAYEAAMSLLIEIGKRQKPEAAAHADAGGGDDG